ncbi:phosphotransferase family protein [Streptomyces sp. NRRL F-5630]|uniref:phosphotransferase family protein n=1 Tax=Streptomyces sp. NRRL F-5630 TaxID=1463864 RepID=UPI0004CC52E1|nr:aminoglycoside phosphotransferase family protein [Streptomyces sp. NRRL F-5630]
MRTVRSGWQGKEPGGGEGGGREAAHSGTRGAAHGSYEPHGPRAAHHAPAPRLHAIACGVAHAAGAQAAGAQAAAPGRHRPVPPSSASRFGWTPDERVPLAPEFPPAAVTEALAAARTADPTRVRVLSGTAHRNAVVWLPAWQRAVVVRRFAPAVAVRRERGFYSEHSVLEAIHAAYEDGAPGAPRVPRVLALGRDADGSFSLHTYEGPLPAPSRVTPDRLTPRHPVNGLRVREADALVDQLAALTRVDCADLEPAAGRPEFFAWLRAELVRLVASLPAPVLARANASGLPGPAALEALLAPLTVTPRTPGLLHGDLNPWNLVRLPGDDLALIDWELALAGDPLYELVRHLHLAPARPSLRARMLGRWSRALPPDRTAGWERDAPVYAHLERLRSAYLDLDRIVTGTALDAPNVARAVRRHGRTLAAARASLAALGAAGGATL